MESMVTKNAVRLMAAGLFMVTSSSAWSMAEKPLNPAYYNNGPFLPRIDMTNLSLEYDVSDQEFEAESKSSSKFTLYKPNGMTKNFTGEFELEADITSNGVLKPGGTFSFTSKDSFFGFGNNKEGTVFKGKLTDLGWSASGDRVEFATANFSGWACDQGWCTQAERLWFKTDGFPNTTWAKDWKDNTNVSGTAVIPVPAAVWLLGSGLIGLLGVGKRKKSLVAALPA